MTPGKKEEEKVWPQDCDKPPGVLLIGPESETSPYAPLNSSYRAAQPFEFELPQELVLPKWPKSAYLLVSRPCAEASEGLLRGGPQCL